MLKKHLYTILFISWMVLITLFSLFSLPDTGEETLDFPHRDKVAHFGFHFVIVFLGTLFVRERRMSKFKINRGIVQIFLFSAGYGVAIEVLQYVMPFDRTAELWDILANLSGAVFGVLLIKKYLTRTAK